MHKWFVDGLVVSSAVLVAGAVTSLFMPGSSNVALAGGTLGGIGAAIATKQQNQRTKEQILRQVRKEVSDALAYNNQEMATIQNKVVALEQEFKHLQKQDKGNLPSKNTPELDVPESGIKASHGFSQTEETPVVDVGDVEKAIAWLQAHEITVERYRQLNPQTDTIFDKLALHLGKRYSSLAPFYKHLKRIVNSGERLRLNLQDKSQIEVSQFTNFCSLLYHNSFLSYYNYSKSEKLLLATVQNRGDIINFFTGGWFEHFIYQVVSQIISSKGLSYTCLRNPQIQFSNGNKFELDLFFLVEGQPLWIECKTGKEYNGHLSKYSTHRNLLAIPKHRSFLVILDIPDSQTTTLTNLWDITVANQDNLAELINAVLQPS